jgi:hypothetical protein
MLTEYERETIINFNKGDKIATVFTYERRWQRHFEQKLGIQPKEVNSFGGKTYLIDKKCIKLPRAKRTRVFTEEQKTAVRERFKKTRGVK